MAQWFQQGCVDVIQLDEQLIIEDVETLRPLMLNPLNERLPQVVVDLRRLRIIDSAGLNLLCEVQEHVQRRGGTIRFAAPNPLIRDVFRVTGLDEEFSLYPDVITAAGAFAR
jgi:anti-anti-sigma factor